MVQKMKVIGNPLGDLSGKLGGIVFTANKSGSTVRTYFKPIKKNTIAQQKTKSLFSQSSSVWKTLSKVEQGQWNVFADLVFNPVSFKERHGSSGFQSFVSLRQSILTSQNKIVPARYDRIPAGPDLITSPINFIPSNSPPLTSVQANLQQSFGPPATFLYSDIRIVPDGRFIFRLTIQAPDGVNDQGDFVDAYGNNYTWRVYFSNPVSQIGGRPKNPLKYLAGTFEPVSFVGDNLTIDPRWNLIFDLVNSFDDYNSRPLQGSIVLVSVYVVARSGTMAPAFSQFIEFDF